jgi:hypothetical protein
VKVPGFELERGADGSARFVADDPDLTWIRIDHQARLQVGLGEIEIESGFTLESDGAIHHLDPADRVGLGPFLALYPGTIEATTMSPSGELTIAFESGARITVAPNPMYEAWSISGFWCPPGGFTG